jgi:hypothetical protein
MNTASRTSHTSPSGQEMARLLLLGCCAAIMIAEAAAGSRGRLPSVQVLSPLDTGLYHEAGSVPILVQVSGADPVAHSAHEVVVRLNVEQEGWRDMLSWSLRDGKSPSEASGSLHTGPAEFRSTFIDIPSGRHTLEVSFRSPQIR